MTKADGPAQRRPAQSWDARCDKTGQPRHHARPPLRRRSIHDGVYRAGCWLATVMLALPGMPGVASAERAAPAHVAIDWAAAARDARLRLMRAVAHQATSFGVGSKHTAGHSGRRDLVHLGTVMAAALPDARLAPIPVLVPIRRLAATHRHKGRPNIRSVLTDSIDSLQFVVGPSGYDAILTIRPKRLAGFGIKTTLPVQLHLAGSALRYGADRPGRRLSGFDDRFAALRKTADADQVTYTFRRYGVPYFVNVGCRRQSSPGHEPTCTEIDVIVRRILKDLRLVGGAPTEATTVGSIRRRAIARKPAANRHDRFVYYPPGRLMPGTSETARGGATKRVEFGRALRFPIRRAPVYANSQIFMHAGNCLGQRIKLPPGVDGRRRYQCRQTGKVLEHVEGHVENYSYPWRDTYCEARGHEKPVDCPLQRGHAGQDLRPASCMTDAGHKNRCRGDQFDVVAVTDGWAWWKTGVHENHLRLNADDGTDKLYYMYLHMSPQSLRAAGMRRGQLVRVRKGQVIGKIGHYWKTKPRGTTTHLHFEIRRGDDIGAPLAPYWTLVRAYERLLGQKGTEITSDRAFNR